MTYFSKSMIGTLLTLTLLVSGNAQSATTLVTQKSDFKAAVKKLKPGDTLMLANGTWQDFEIVFTGKGLPDKPITLTAEEKGKVIISGQSNLRLAGEHLVVSGLVFKDGYTPTSEVISFRRNSEDLANHSRVTEVVIDHYNNPERTEADFWVMMYGKNNRFDHNHLIGKSNKGVTMAVRLNTEASQENHHRIDHNYFGHRPNLGSNGGETLRIGTSHYSLTNSFTTVENNYFERCNGEVEIISNKSGNNVYRGNVFLESRGTLTLRHGNDNLVENNVFFGHGVDHTGGIRVINKRQTVRNNYLQGLTGSRFGSTLTIMNGVPNSSINRYHQVEDSVIINNTIINSEHIELAAGSDDERSAVPITSKFENNLIYNQNGEDVFTIHDDISGIEFSGNVLNEVQDFSIKKGFISRNVELKQHDNGLMYPVSADLRGVGVSESLEVLSRDKTGVSWYAKPDNKPLFDTGKVIPVSAGEEDLAAVVKAANAGDMIELQPGHYQVTKLVTINKPLTIRAQAATGAEKPNIEFERTALFEIQDGGSLKLDGIHISGKSAPDSAGNSAIRTSRYSMLTPYQLLVENCKVTDLDINHSFNFLTVAKGTFADRIDIKNSEFSNITGAILELDKETDDLGLYNAEYVEISNSSFTKIGKALAVLYRGGTDESTFGPHFDLHDSVLSDVGNSSRNKYTASVYLLGVQLADINDNTLNKSQPVQAVLTVGDTTTNIIDNRFLGTPAPEIVNGSANMSNNEVTE